MNPQYRPGLGTLFLASSLFLGLYLAWLVLADPATLESSWTGGLTLVFSGTLAAALAWKARSSQAAQANAGSWAWIALGLSAWAGGDAARLLLSLVLPNPLPAPLFEEALHLAGAACLLVGLLRYPTRPRQHMSLFRLGIETAITSAAVISLAYMVIFRPISALILNSAGQVSLIFYPSADFLLLVVLLNLYILHEPGHFPPPLSWIALSLAVYSISDLTFAALIPQGGYTLNNLVNAGWVLGDLIMAAGAYHSLRSAAQPAAQTAPARQGWGGLLARTLSPIQTLLPLVLTVVLGWNTLIDWQLQSRFDPVGVWSTVILSLALIGRQGILAGEFEFQQYARLVDSIAEPAFICSPQGDLRLLNPAMRQIAGLEHASPLLGITLQSLISPEANTSAILAAAIRSPAGWNGEIHLTRAEGGLVPVLLALRPVKRPGGGKLTLAGTAHDLRQEKRQQADLQQAYEEIRTAHANLEKLNADLEQRVIEKTANLSEAYAQLETQNRALRHLDQLKSDFVSLVSHELRAPLTNINGGLELTLARSRAIPPQERETLTIVQAEITRLTRFVETILDLSALDAGRVPVYPAPLDLDSVISTLQRQMTHLPSAARVRWHIPPELPELLADERALSSVLFHLLDNAMKYAPLGSIDVRAGTDPKAHFAWICVEDEGEGIPEDDLPLLFTRFFRSRVSDAQVVYGHGLGLYIVQHFMEAMNGTITAANRPQGGASFTCRLPLVIEEMAGEENGNEDFNSR